MHRGHDSNRGSTPALKRDILDLRSAGGETAARVQVGHDLYLRASSVWIPGQLKVLAEELGLELTAKSGFGSVESFSHACLG